MSNHDLKDFLKSHDPARHISASREQALRNSILQRAIEMGQPVRASAVQAAALPLNLMRPLWSISGLLLLVLGFYVGQVAPLTVAAAPTSQVVDSAYMQEFTLSANVWQVP